MLEATPLPTREISVRMFGSQIWRLMPYQHTCRNSRQFSQRGHARPLCTAFGLACVLLMNHRHDHERSIAASINILFRRQAAD